MAELAALSALARAFFALWALLLCLTYIGSAVLAAVKRRFGFTAAALFLLAPCYLMWQIIFDISLFGGAEGLSDISRAAGGLPWLWWLIAFALFTALSALLLGLNIRYDRNFITPEAIKLYLDKVPCGICCWRPNGRVLFSNICMNRLCISLTGKPLLNGNLLRKAVEDGIMTVDGRVWRFASREIAADGEQLWEMIASDITAEYARTEALRRDRAELERLNRELGDYYLSIDEQVKRREILQAKMNIHDEMNRLMLSTVAADMNGAQSMDRIFSLWERNALMLCMEADRKTAGQEKEALCSLADALGLELIWLGEPPESVGELFFLTAREAVVNAVKHAHADRLEISFEQTETDMVCSFTNGGKMPEGGARFEGGLLNISRLAEKQGAALSAEAGEEFVLTLRLELPKNQPIG